MSWSDHRPAMLRMTASACSGVLHPCSPVRGLRTRSSECWPPFQWMTSTISAAASSISTTISVISARTSRWRVLIVVRGACHAAEPSKGAFDDPTAWKRHESFRLIGALDDFSFELWQEAARGARAAAMSSHHNFRPGQQNKLVSEPPIAAPDEHAQLVEADQRFRAALGQAIAAGGERIEATVQLKRRTKLSR